MRRFIFACLLLFALPARADFMISNAVLEFNAQTGAQQDVELISRSEQNEYIETEIYEVLRPGLADEEKKPLDDPAKSPILVTPDKTVLPPGGRKALRLVLLHPRENTERIYRVVVKPVVNGVESEAKMGLKILVGYEILAIVRPENPSTEIAAQRKGKNLHVRNNGNTGVLLQSGQQCDANKECKNLPVIRVYAGAETDIALPMEGPATYFIWDGSKLTERHFD